MFVLREQNKQGNAIQPRTYLFCILLAQEKKRGIKNLPLQYLSFMLVRSVSDSDMFLVLQFIPLH
jgi:hypothetical protein